MGVRGLGNKMKFEVLFVENNLVYSWIVKSSCGENWGRNRNTPNKNVQSGNGVVHKRCLKITRQKLST